MSYIGTYLFQKWKFLCSLLAPQVKNAYQQMLNALVGGASAMMDSMPKISPAVSFTLHVAVSYLLEIQINGCFFWAEAKVPTGSPCGQGDVCADTNALCQDNICQCGAGFYQKGRQCCKKLLVGIFCAVWVFLKLFIFPDPEIPLQDSCGTGDQCSDDNAMCIGGKCICVDNFFQRNNRCGEHMHFLMI